MCKVFNDKTNGKWEATRELAKQTGPDALAAFEEMETYVKDYGQNRFSIDVFPDWAPHSFAFSMLDANTDQHIFNGGIIYSGPGLAGGAGQKSDGSFPSLTVDLCPVAGHHWGMHT